MVPELCHVLCVPLDIVQGGCVEASSWFTRGWTLQELLAPPAVLFFDCHWEPMGSRMQLAREISGKTGIPKKALENYRFNKREYCMAQKLSWSSQRTTTRTEVKAYCLLGICDVNMPLLYGEGHKAFQRLQEKIMKINVDLSLFLWHDQACEGFGMLANGPQSFCKLPANLDYRELQDLTRGYNVNNAGMTLRSILRPHALTNDLKTIYILYLGRSFQHSYGIFLEERRDSAHVRYYRRVSVDGETWIADEARDVDTWSWRPRLRELFISREPLVKHSITGTRGVAVEVDVYGSIFTGHQRPDNVFDMPLQNWPDTGRSTHGRCGMLTCMSRGDR